MNDSFIPKTIAEALKLGDETAAILLDERYREILAQEKASFVEKGLILSQIELRELWRHMKPATLQEPAYHSMEDYMARASGYSVRRAHGAKNAVRALSHVAVERLQQMPAANVIAMSKLS